MEAEKLSYCEALVDIMTLMAHVGYLGFHSHDKTVYIPNAEVRNSFVSATESPTYQKERSRQ